MSLIRDLQCKHPPWRVSDGPRCCAPDTIAEFNGSPESPPLKGPIVWRQCELNGRKGRFHFGGKPMTFSGCTRFVQFLQPLVLSFVLVGFSISIASAQTLSPSQPRA